MAKTANIQALEQHKKSIQKFFLVYKKNILLNS